MPPRNNKPIDTSREQRLIGGLVEYLGNVLRWSVFDGPVIINRDPGDEDDGYRRVALRWSDDVKVITKRPDSWIVLR